MQVVVQEAVACGRPSRCGLISFDAGPGEVAHQVVQTVPAGQMRYQQVHVAQGVEQVLGLVGGQAGQRRRGEDVDVRTGMQAEQTEHALLSIDEVMDRIDAVTLEDVRDVASHVFTKPEILSVVGPG